MQDNQEGDSETRTCGRCGCEYEAYTVLVKDNFIGISDHARIKEKWGNICKDCRRDVADGKYYAVV